MADLSPEQEAAAREAADLLGIDLASAREAVAVVESLERRCVVDE